MSLNTTINTNRTIRTGRHPHMTARLAADGNTVRRLTKTTCVIRILCDTNRGRPNSRRSINNRRTKTLRDTNRVIHHTTRIETTPATTIARIKGDPTMSLNTTINTNRTIRTGRHPHMTARLTTDRHTAGCLAEIAHLANDHTGASGDNTDHRIGLVRKSRTDVLRGTNRVVHHTTGIKTTTATATASRNADVSARLHTNRHTARRLTVRRYVINDRASYLGGCVGDVCDHPGRDFTHVGCFFGDGSNNVGTRNVGHGGRIKGHVTNRTQVREHGHP
jgi:hypothetical protein